MPPCETTPGNFLVVGPCQIGQISVLDPDAVQRMGGRPCEWRSGRLMEEYVEKGFFCRCQDLHFTAPVRVVLLARLCLLDRPLALSSRRRIELPPRRPPDSLGAFLRPPPP